MVISKNKFFSIEDAAKILNVSIEDIKIYLKKGYFKAQYNKNRIQIFGKELLSYKDFREHFNLFRPTALKLSRSDKIRRNLISFLCTYGIPALSIFIYFKTVGRNFAVTDLGSILMFVILFVSWTLSRQLYKYLFPRYEDDLPTD